MCLPSPVCQTAWRNQGATPSAGTSLGKVDTTMVMIPVFAIQTFATLATDILHHSPLHCFQLSSLYFKICSLIIEHGLKKYQKNYQVSDMRKVEILPQTDFWGFEISVK